MIQRIKCFFGRHEWRATHFHTGKKNGEIIYRSITDACCWCGKNGERRVIIDKRNGVGQ